QAPKTSKPSSRTAVRATASLESVLEVCNQLPSISGEPRILREHIAKSARETFHAAVAGVLLREGDIYLPGAIATAEGAGKSALLAHAKSFATQALEQKRLLNFKFSYRASEGEVLYHGLAQPLVTAQTVAVLLLVRDSVFTATEVSGFAMLGNV